jgi:hypothetical protein
LHPQREAVDRTKFDIEEVFGGEQIEHATAVFMEFGFLRSQIIPPEAIGWFSP